MAKALHVEVGKTHYPPQSSIEKSAPILEIIIFLSRQPTPENRRFIKTQTECLAETQTPQIPRRSTLIILADNENQDHVDINGRLHNVITKELPKASILRRKRPRRFCIVADETTYYLVKEMIVLHHGDRWSQLVGLVFLRSHQSTQDGIIEKVSRRFSGIGVKRIATNEKSFDDIALDDTEVLGPVTWVIVVRGSVGTNNYYDQSLAAAFGVIRVATDLAIFESLKTEKKTFQQRRKDFMADQKGLTMPSGEVYKYADYIDYLKDQGLHQRHSIVEKNALSYPMMDGIGDISGSSPEEQESGQMIQLETGWGDPYAGIEQFAAVQVSDFSTVLSEIETGFRTLDSLQATTKLARTLPKMRLGVSQALIRLQMGQWKLAQQLLQQELRGVEIVQEAYTPDPDGLRAVHESAKYWLAETSFRLGICVETYEMLETDTINWNLEQANAIHRNSHRKELIRSVHILRLQGLCKASMGHLYGAVDDKMHRAQQRIRYFCPREAEAHVETDDKNLDYNVACILMNFTRSRILALRGDYGQALDLMLRVTSQSIVSFGESHIWTLDAAVYTSNLMVLTSKVDQGRILAEGALDAIVQTFTNDHPLAVEASSVLVSVARAEGRLLQGLQNASELVKSIDNNPQTPGDCMLSIELKLQLGSLQLQSGCFKTSENTFQLLLENSPLESDHPIALKVRSQLALAQYHLGKTSTAKKNVLLTLGQQFLKLHGLPEDGPWADDATASQTIQRLLDTGSVYRVQNSSEDAETSCLDEHHLLHPDILNSLLTLAKLEAAVPGSDDQYVLKLLDLVHSASAQQLGTSNELTMDAAIVRGKLRLQLSTTECDSLAKKETFCQADEDFRSVFNKASLVTSPTAEAQQPKQSESQHWLDNAQSTIDLSIDLSPSPLCEYHPAVLKAEQESIIANLYFNDEVKIIRSSIITASDRLTQIIRAQGCKLGWNHPDCLKSLLLILPVKLACNDIDGAERVVEKLTQRLSRDDIRGERVLECLRMEARIVQVLMTKPDRFSSKIEHLLTSLIENAQREEDMEGDEGLVSLFRGLKSRCQGLRADLTASGL